MRVLLCIVGHFTSSRKHNGLANPFDISIENAMSNNENEEEFNQYQQHNVVINEYSSNYYGMF